MLEFDTERDRLEVINIRASRDSGSRSGGLLLKNFHGLTSAISFSEKHANSSIPTRLSYEKSLNSKFELAIAKHPSGMVVPAKPKKFPFSFPLSQYNPI